MHRRKEPGVNYWMIPMFEIRHLQSTVHMISWICMLTYFLFCAETAKFIWFSVLNLACWVSDVFGCFLLNYHSPYCIAMFVWLVQKIHVPDQCSKAGISDVAELTLSMLPGSFLCENKLVHEALHYLAYVCILSIAWTGSWASVSEPHTSALNFKFCPYSTYVTAGSAGHSYYALLLPPRAPVVQPHSIIPFIKQMSNSRPRLSNANRWSGKGWSLRLGWKSHRIVPPLLCYLAHAHPTVLYIHLVYIMWHVYILLFYTMLSFPKDALAIALDKENGDIVTL